MYGEIQIDGSRLLKPGKNLLVVKVTGRVDGNSSEASSAAIDFFYSSVRESEQEGGKVTMKNDNILKDIAHGFYGADPAGIWQPVKLSMSNPVKVKESLLSQPWRELLLI